MTLAHDPRNPTGTMTQQEHNARRRAAAIVAGNAKGFADCVELLTMLGLYEPELRGTQPSTRFRRRLHGTVLPFMP